MRQKVRDTFVFATIGEKFRVQDTDKNTFNPKFPWSKDWIPIGEVHLYAPKHQTAKHCRIAMLVGNQST